MGGGIAVLSFSALVWTGTSAQTPRLPSAVLSPRAAHLPATASAPATLATTRPAPAPADPLIEARRLRLKGEYDAAESLYREQAKSPNARLAVACGLTEIDLRLGRYAAGLERLRSLPPEVQETADWHVCLAALLAETGQLVDAADHNRAALTLDARHLRARCQLGRIQETRGELDDAVQTYRLLEEIMTGDGGLPDDPESLTWLGQGFLRHSLLTRHPNLVRRTKHVLHRVYQEAFDQVDPNFWPARLAAAELLLEKHNLAEAAEDFRRILEQNPHCAEAHVGLGQVALEQWLLEEVEQHAEAALQINPRSVAARLLLAQLHAIERQPAKMAAAARKALGINPASLEALGLLAAAQSCRGRTADAEAARQQALAVSPRPAMFHLIVGSALLADHRFSAAEAELRKAVEFAPHWPEPRTELARLYLDLGEEARARPLLEQAFALDGFNSRTHRVLELLDRLDQFAEIRTDRFIIRYDKQLDGVLAPYMLEAFEQMHEEICDAFETKLDQPTLLEVFPSHIDFSARIAARPFVATIGACSGRVITMTSPVRHSPFGRHNWRNTLRHEFAHTVTLAATNHRIPRWLTEGLSMAQEKTPRTLSTRLFLARALRDGRLFPLDAIDRGFTRPQRPDDVHLAYLQGEWMVQYIETAHGPHSIHRLLRAFRSEQPQPKAVSEALGVEAAAFEQGFRSWAEKQVAGWDLQLPPTEEVATVEALLDEQDRTPDLLTRLAWAELQVGNLTGAEAAAREALESEEDHLGASEVLCHILMQQMLQERDEDRRTDLAADAKLLLRHLLQATPGHLAATKYLGCVEQALESWEKAARLLSDYQRRVPDDPDAARRLAAIHWEQGEFDQAVRQWEIVSELEQDDVATRVRLAAHRQKNRDYQAAADWYRKALDIDPYDPEIHLAFGDVQLELGHIEAAERAYRAVVQLLPKDPRGYAGMARVHRARDDSEAAAKWQAQADAQPWASSAPAASRPAED